MRSFAKSALFLCLFCLFPSASYANLETPQAVTLAWDKVFVSTAEGIDVWLRINVVGAAPTEIVELKFIFQTASQLATANDDYVPTNWPSGTKGVITGLQRFAYVKIDILNNLYSEPIETFQVELRSDASGTVISGQARATVSIARSRLMNPVVGYLESCIHVGEPANNTATSAGVIAPNGGWCNSDFRNEQLLAVDYYRLKPSSNGTITIRLENTTRDQHDLQLYLYYLDGTGQYQFYQQSTNPDQQAEFITAPLAANSNYLISVYWERSSGSKVPSYRLNADWR
ncbi:hypothetical protein [Herpetosiphon geysericola]|uniref:Calx-beta domain-containing protein n=1 Tax=Herpetosiphon geysericola TaxID=70996 RepID=A0A0P6YEJ9_9CHLR|nr:hypothetical protein [Herpetosiphon geysericola]KPL90576.1 hypothetical protein SE18_05700 [Herpetosiphon geysericola]